MTGSPTKVNPTLRMIAEVIVPTVCLLPINNPTAMAQSTFALSYSARLRANGVRHFQQHIDTIKTPQNMTKKDLGLSAT